MVGEREREREWRERGVLHFKYNACTGKGEFRGLQCCLYPHIALLPEERVW